MIKITAMGYFHPEHKIENSFFETLNIESSSEWVEERTGIRSRHSVMTRDEILKIKEIGYSRWREEFWNEDRHSLAMFAQKAIQASLDANSISNPTDILICGTSVPDFDIPANSATIAKKLGWNHSVVFDVNSACSSFIVDLQVACSLLGSGAYRSAAIFNPERYSLRLDFNERSSCVLFGDGSSFARLEKNASQKFGLEVIDTLVHSHPENAESVKIPVGKSFWQNGSAVQKFAVTKTISASLEILEKNSMSIKDVDYFVAHQANLRMLNSVAEKLGLNGEQHLFNVAEFGNQGAAGAPCVLAMNWQKFKKGDVILVTVVGSGLTWASALLRCG